MKKKKKYSDFHKNFKNKTILIFIMSIVLTIIFSLRLIWLYNSEYRDRAYAQQLKTIEVPAKRGKIIDVNKNILAEDVKTNALYFYPDYIEDGELSKLKDVLSNIIGLNDDEISNILDNNKTIRITNYLKSNQVKEIEKLNLNCLEIYTEDRRYYPGGESLSYILGFIDNEGNGAYGIEKYYNDLLKGKAGLNIYTGSKTGNSIPYKNKDNLESVSGKNIKLNIDENINAIVSNAAKEAIDKYEPKSISIIVTEPNTNKVVSLENFPRFNSNLPREGRTEKESEALNNLSNDEKIEKLYEIWRNIAISNSYEPGSVQQQKNLHICVKVYMMKFLELE